MRVAIGILVLASLARAADIQVPGDAPSIPAAIALAQDGDTIVVGPGTWVGSVNYFGKSLTVRSTDGFAVTTIDGGQAADAVRMGSAPGTAVLEGFTVIGGTDGRVNVANGNALVRSCRVLGAGSSGGVGIRLMLTGTRLVTDCAISGNLGGGIRTQVKSGTQSVERCLIEGNGSDSVVRGGGLFGSDGLVAVDCIIRGNTALFGGGAAQLQSQKGCWFVGNVATVSGGAYFGEGLPFGALLVIEDAAWVDNDAPLYGGAQIDTAAFGESGPHILKHCLIAGNTDDGGNVGLYSHIDTFSGPAYARLEQCTVLGNTLTSEHSQLQVAGSIVRAVAVPFDAPSIVVDHSDVEGGWPGTGNFDADPAFVDAAHDVVALLPGSACADAGGPDLPLDPDGTVADVGALALSPVADAHLPLFGSRGFPGLSCLGTLAPGSALTLRLTRALPGAPAALLVGIPPGLFAPFKGGVLVPAPSLVIGGLSANAGGQIILPATWPVGVPSGLRAWLQFWIADPAGTQGFAASNGLGLVAP